MADDNPASRAAGRRARRGPAGVLAGALLIACGLQAACSSKETAASAGNPRSARAAVPDGPLILYCGRAEALIEPLLERFRDEADVDLEVRYGDNAQLTAALLAEGTRTPADAFLSTHAAALGTLSRRSLLRELPMDVVRRVPSRFAAMEQKHDWIGLSARARAVVYDRARLRPETLPQGIEELGDPRFRGRFGIAPATASFAEHMAAYRVVEGDEALAELLSTIRDNSPRTFPDDGAIVRAVARGEIDWGLVDHQHLLRELDGGAAGRLGTFFMRQGRASGFVEVSGIGLLTDDPRALELVRFLLAEEAQRHLASATYEYPLAADIRPSRELPPLSSVPAAPVDFADVAAVLRETQQALRRAGLLG